jgi:hypothetical protein
LASNRLPRPGGIVIAGIYHPETGKKMLGFDPWNELANNVFSPAERRSDWYGLPGTARPPTRHRGSTMRVLSGIIWFLVIYFGILTGAPYVAGEIASRRHQSAMVAYRDTRRLVRNYHAWIMAGTGMLVIVASGAGVLPGTRTD